PRGLGGGYSPNYVGGDQPIDGVDPRRFSDAGVGGSVRRVDRARARSAEHVRLEETAARGRDSDAEHLVAVARRANAGLRTANAFRTSGRGGSRQGLVDSQERVLDADSKSGAAGSRARGIEDGEVNRLGPGAVLDFRAQ